MYKKNILFYLAKGEREKRVDIKVAREGINPVLRHGQLAVTRMIGIKEDAVVGKCAKQLRWWNNSVVRAEKDILLMILIGFIVFGIKV